MQSDGNAKEDADKESVYQCSECSAGLMHLKHITYFTWLNDELITVPNFPAWICDVCGRREFDPRAVTWLNTLLNPAAGRSSPRRFHPKDESALGDRLQP